MDRMKIGIVGLNFGKSIVNQVLAGSGSKYFELAAVCDMDRIRADEIAVKSGVMTIYAFLVHLALWRTLTAAPR